MGYDRPLVPGFDRAIVAMAKLQRLDLQPVANPIELDTVARVYRETGFIPVWVGDSTHTVFGKPVTNWVFRGLHDYTHLLFGHGTSLHGEFRTFTRQRDALRFLPGITTAERRLYGRMLYVEIVEQAEHYTETGSFPADQRAFMLDRLPDLRGLSCSHGS